MAAILSQLVTTDDESLLAAFPLSTFYNLHEWTLLLSTLRALLVVLTRYEHLLACSRHRVTRKSFNNLRSIRCTQIS